MNGRGCGSSDRAMPFAHLTVVDIATLAAAPQVAAFFGDLGARVIKVEHPRGDPLRRILDARGAALQWKIVNRNKECIALDLATAAGRAALRGLLAGADLLVANATGERLRALGLDGAELRASFPGLVAVNLTAWGTSGPWADRAGSGTLAEAASGLAALTGEDGGPPGLSPVGLGDHLGVLQAIVAALVGLCGRAAPGVDGRAAGGFADVAMIEPLLGLMSARIAEAFRTGEDPARHGNRFPTVAPRNAYPTADGHWVALTAGTDDLVRRALAVVGRPALADDPRFATNRERVRHAGELDAVLGGWIAERSRDDVLAAFVAARVSVAAIDPPTTVARNPHLLARGSLVDVVDPEVGTLRLAAPPAGGRIRWLGRGLGADDRAVLGGQLGLDDEAIARAQGAR